jgi:uncharacterized protein
MMSPLETLVRDVRTALIEYDLATLQLLVSPRVVCHVPGRGRLAGDYQGFERVFALWLEVTQKSAIRLELEVEDVLSGRRYIAASCLSRVETPHGSLEGRLICLMRLDEGRIVECWLYASGP